MSGEVKDFDLKGIINKSLEDTAKIAPDVKSYLETISDDELSKTSAQVKKIARVCAKNGSPILFVIELDACYVGSPFSNPSRSRGATAGNQIRARQASYLE